MTMARTGTGKRKAPYSPSFDWSKPPSFDWSELPADLLSMIARKLSCAFDFIRFRSVCRSWRSAADSVDIPPSPPLLLLPHDLSSAERTFFSLTTRTSRMFHLQELRGQSVFGSAYGWFALGDRHYDMSLWSPLTGAHIPLPPASAGLLRYCMGPCRPFVFSYPRKVFLSSKPSDDGDCFVVVILFNYRGLVFCRLGDERWTQLDVNGLHVYPASLVFHEGRCLVFDRKGTGVAVDLAGGPNKSQKIIPMPSAAGLGNVKINTCFGIEPCFADGLFMAKTALKGTSKEIIFMVMHRGFLNGFATSESPSSLEHVRFFKLDTPRGGGDLLWFEVDNIGNDLAVFLSGNHASIFDIGSTGSSQGCIENSIYFGTTNLYDHMLRHPRGGTLFMDILGTMIGGTSDHNCEKEEAEAILSSSICLKDRYGKQFDNSTWFTLTL